MRLFDLLTQYEEFHLHYSYQQHVIMYLNLGIFKATDLTFFTTPTRKKVVTLKNELHSIEISNRMIIKWDSFEENEYAISTDSGEIKIKIIK